jgi:hypothetical protein
MRLEGLGQLKIPKTLSRIEPVTFWLLAYRLSPLPFLRIVWFHAAVMGQYFIKFSAG